MSQRDLVLELRAARLTAPPAVRDRVRLIAAAAPADRRTRFSWRKALVVLVPVAAAVAAGVLLTRPSHKPAVPETLVSPPVLRAAQAKAGASGSAAGGTPAPSTTHGAFDATVPNPSTTRVQRYQASLTLRVAGATAVSTATKRAIQVATALGGYVVSAHVDARSAAASAELVLKVPRGNVRRVVARLAALGTITAEQVDIQDLQAGIATGDRTIERLQRQLSSLRTEQQTPAVARQIAALTTRIERLQRQRAATIRAARFATVRLQLQTKPVPVARKHGHGPLHGLGVAFHWIGIAAVYAAALGLPALALVILAWLAVRTVRRRREDALLSGP